MKDSNKSKKMNASKLIGVLVSMAVLGLSLGDAITGWGIKGNKNLLAMVLGTGSSSGPCFSCYTDNSGNIHCAQVDCGSSGSGSGSGSSSGSGSGICDTKQELVYETVTSSIVEVKCILGNLYFCQDGCYIFARNGLYESWQLIYKDVTLKQCFL